MNKELEDVIKKIEQRVDDVELLIDAIKRYNAKTTVFKHRHSIASVDGLSLIHI